MISKNDIKKAWKKNKIAFIFCIFVIMVFAIGVVSFIYEFSMEDAEKIEKMNSFGEIFSFFALRFLAICILAIIVLYIVIKMKKERR